MNTKEELVELRDLRLKNFNEHNERLKPLFTRLGFAMGVINPDEYVSAQLAIHAEMSGWGEKDRQNQDSIRARLFAVADAITIVEIIAAKLVKLGPNTNLDVELAQLVNWYGDYQQLKKDWDAENQAENKE